MKLLEWVLDFSFRKNMKAMQFSFGPGGGTIDAIFIVRQQQEKNIVANKPLYFPFMHLHWGGGGGGGGGAFRSLGVDEWAVHVIQVM